MADDTKVHLVDENGTLTYTDSKGTATEFRPVYLRTLWVTADLLTLKAAASVDDSGAPGSVQFVKTRRFITGSATLERDSIDIIGRSGSNTYSVPLTIHFRTADEERRYAERFAAEAAETLGVDSLGRTPYNASLGFAKADWEQANKDEWFLELTVPEAVFEELAESLLSNRVAKLSIGLTLYGVYGTAYDCHAPPSLGTTWYLRPHKRSGSTDYPELAHGTITVWCLEHITVNLGRIEGRTRGGDGDADGADDLDRPEKMSVDISQLDRVTQAVAELRAALRNVGWILAAAIVVAALLK